MEISKDAILLCRDNRIFSINNAGLELLAAAFPERALGKSILEIVHPDCHAFFQERIHRLSPRGEATLHHFEAQIIRFDGTALDVQIAVAPSFGHDGKAIQLILRATRDRTVTANALRDNEESLRFALRMAQMGSWSWDLVTNHVTWSAGYECLFGLEPGSFNGAVSKMEEHLHPEDRPSVVGELLRVREEQTDLHQEFRVVWPNGDIHWLERKGRLLRDETGKPVRLVNVDMDITPRKQMENHLQFTLKQVRSRFRLPGIRAGGGTHSHRARDP